jgi:hypothetical protein
MVMSGMRNVTTSFGLVAQTPPEAIVEQRAPRLLTRIPDDRRQGAVELLHWGFGAVGGAVFGLLPATVRRRRWAGPAYGLLFWVLFEAGIAPALGLAQAKRTRPAERVAFLADHVLYGLVVASSWPHDED